MPDFTWQGVQGKSFTNGVVEAASLEEARQHLLGMQIVVTQLQAQKKSGAKAPVVSTKRELKKYSPKKIRNRDVLMATKKLATMVDAGLPILKTLKMLGDQEQNPHMQVVLRQIAITVEGGSTLSEAFAMHPAVFDTIYINLLKAGESSGRLPNFLRRLVIQLHKAEAIRKKIKSAMMYPAILLMVAIGVVMIMLIKVVPVFQSMFGAAGQELPGPTQLVVMMSEFLRAPEQGGLLLAAVIGGVIMFRYLLRTRYGVRRGFHAWLLRLKLVGEVIRQSTLARVAMIQGNLSAAGVSLLEALDIIQDAVGILPYKEALAAVRQGVSEGTPLSELFGRYPALFPPTFTQMIAVGEETGNMDEMYDSIAGYYEEEFDLVVDRLTELLEPFMIIFVGTTVGFIIVALYMPIFQIGQTI